jgi:hypothetical protein
MSPTCCELTQYIFSLSNVINRIDGWTIMYRCYVVQSGRIIAGEDIDAATLDEAKTAGFKMIAERTDFHQIDGIEIWRGSSFLYKSEAPLITEAQNVESI